MAHHMYFDDNTMIKSDPFTFTFEYGRILYTFYSDHGVFSKDHVDEGTKYLVEGFKVSGLKPKRVLDFGCGLGVVSIILNRGFEIEQVEGIDVNPRAVQLAVKNGSINGCNVNFHLSDGFTMVNGSYDLIISNPPIRVGKTKLYHWYQQARSYLNDHGSLMLVVRKQQGADTTINALRQWYDQVKPIYKKKGFVVIQASWYGRTSETE